MINEVETGERRDSQNEEIEERGERDERRCEEMSATQEMAVVSPRLLLMKSD